MRQNKIQKLFVHLVPDSEGQTTAERANQFHIQMIASRLDAASLTADQKVEVLARIKSHISF